MISHDKKRSETFHPKTPGPRRPLHEMMNNLMGERNLRTNIESRRDIEDSDHDSVDDPHVDNLQRDDESYSDDSNLDEDVADFAESHSSRNGRASSLGPSPVSQRITKTSSKASPKSSNSPRNVTQSVGNEKVPTTTSNRSSKRHETESNDDEEKKGTLLYRLPIAVVIIIIGVILYRYEIWNIKSALSTKSETLRENELMNNFVASIDDISYKFKKQHSDIWNDIYTGVVDIIKHPSKRSVIFLFSNQDDPMFCLAKMLGNATKAVLHSDEYLWLTPSDFVNDYGGVIEKFKGSIEKQKIVIIENILAINPEAMRAFHNFCDSENPLVSQTIYIIAMIAKGFKGNEKPHIFVEEQLRRKLEGKINPDKLQPLIARLTDAAIIHVQPEPDITSCPLRY